jgi:hypothetical protein
VVSNHGGRQLDGAPSSASVLPAIAEAVKGKMTIFADGGVRTGTDVFRMLALGADGVLIGRAGPAPPHRRLVPQVRAAEMKDVKFCFAHLHIGTMHSKKPITEPSQLKGMKIRSSNGTNAAFMSLLGATNVQVSAPEARDALEKGVADALAFPWDSSSASASTRPSSSTATCAVRVRLRLGDEQGLVRQAGRRPEEGHRRPLQQRVGRQGRRRLGRLRGRRPGQAGPPATRSTSSPPSS